MSIVAQPDVWLEGGEAGCPPELGCGGAECKAQIFVIFRHDELDIASGLRAILTLSRLVVYCSGSVLS